MIITEIIAVDPAALAHESASCLSRIARAKSERYGHWSGGEEGATGAPPPELMP